MKMKRNLPVIAGLIVMALLAGCSDQPAAQPAASAPAVTIPPKAETDAKPSSGATGGGTAAAPAASGAAEAPKAAEPAKPEAAKNEPPAKAEPPKTETAAQAKPATPEAPKAQAPSQAPAAAAPAPAAKEPAAAAAPKAEAPAAAAKPAAKAPAVADLAAKAEPLFKDNCMVCHGDQLQGGGGPNISKVGERRTKEQLVTKITGGGKVMPPFKDSLKPEEIEVLAAWLATKK